MGGREGGRGRNVRMKSKFNVRGGEKERMTDRLSKDKEESAQGTMAQKSTQTKTAVETIKQGRS